MFLCVSSCRCSNFSSLRSISRSRWERTVGKSLGRLWLDAAERGRNIVKGYFLESRNPFYPGNNVIDLFQKAVYPSFRKSYLSNQTRCGAKTARNTGNWLDFNRSSYLHPSQLLTVSVHACQFGGQHLKFISERFFSRLIHTS